MKLQRLVGRGFRNLRLFDLHFEKPFVVIAGPNGQGKTNLLEAIWYLANLKPLRGHRTRDLIGWDEEEATLSGWIASSSSPVHHRVDLQAKGRKIRRNGSEISDIREWFGLLRAIAFTPLDGTIVTEGPAFRRKWLDRAAFIANPAHLDYVRNYRRVVAQKAAILRQGNPDPYFLDTLDDQLVEHGTVLAHHRSQVLLGLLPHIQDLHGTLSKGKEEISLHYRSKALGDDHQPNPDAFRAALQQSRPNEIARRTTLVGPQRDEVVIKLNGKAARTFGSRGQVRTLVLAMKLAELLGAHHRGQTPLFLLDDLSSELDKARTQTLVEVLDQVGAQVFVTTTDVEYLRGFRQDQIQWLSVSEGQISGP